jgi:hypothetical protein
VLHEDRAHILHECSWESVCEEEGHHVGEGRVSEKDGGNPDHEVEDLDDPIHVHHGMNPALALSYTCLRVSERVGGVTSND